MKAILEFNLPKESIEHMTAIQAQDWKHGLWQLDQKLRSTVKHGVNEIEIAYADKIRSELYNYLSENNLSFD